MWCKGGIPAYAGMTWVGVGVGECNGRRGCSGGCGSGWKRKGAGGAKVALVGVRVGERNGCRGAKVALVGVRVGERNGCRGAKVALVGVRVGERKGAGAQGVVGFGGRMV